MVLPVAVALFEHGARDIHDDLKGLFKSEKIHLHPQRDARRPEIPQTKGRDGSDMLFIENLGKLLDFLQEPAQIEKVLCASDSRGKNKKESSPSKEMSILLHQYKPPEPWTIIDQKATDNTHVSKASNTCDSSQKMEAKATRSDILDLGSNIQPWKFCERVLLKKTAHSYFENRSQISRICGAHPPRHMTITCKDCDMEIPHYV